MVSVYMNDAGATAIVLVCPILGLLFALFYAFETAKISLETEGSPDKPLLENKDVVSRIRDLTERIADGAHAFLYREYMYLSVFIVVFFFVVFCFVGLASTHSGKDKADGAFTAIAFLFGAITSILSGLLGMKIAVFANGRTALKCAESIGAGFKVAFKAGAVMGFSLSAMGIIVLFIVINLLSLHYKNSFQVGSEATTRKLFEAVAGYGLGGSSIALFGRVGGGIYTKAADVGADLVGKVEQGIPEDDIRNPATIADNVGDNVGDIAGMGADLFGSFAEASCAALVVASESSDLSSSYPAMMFPIAISSIGILVCMATSVFATHVQEVKDLKGAEPILKMQLLISTLLMTPLVFILSYIFLPASFAVSDKVNVKHWQISICICTGLWSGLVIGYITEYFTSNTYSPVLEVVEACKTGAATNIIYGLALGYLSVIVPVFCIAATIFIGLSLAGTFGIAVAALGILSTMSIGLTIDAYGPISDNAGGIAEMADMGKEVRDRTDALDAAGNTTAAIGKGFAIGSAALVSLALFGGFTTIGGLFDNGVNLLSEWTFTGLLIGAMLPYWFSALTMKSVGKAALAMVQEVRRQFRDIPGIMEYKADPDYEACIRISTDASLREMIAPGLLVILTPIIVGFIFGKLALSGILVGALISGVQVAISASNTGGAWDNAKKYYEGNDLKGTPEHAAAVIGDTVGDPLKDTSGPSLNILIKLMAIISLVFVPAFKRIGVFGSE